MKTRGVTEILLEEKNEISSPLPTGAAKRRATHLRPRGQETYCWRAGQSGAAAQQRVGESDGEHLHPDHGIPHTLPLCPHFQEVGTRCADGTDGVWGDGRRRMEEEYQVLPESLYCPTDPPTKVYTYMDKPSPHTCIELPSTL